MDKILLFVYGTLKRGQNANGLLKESKYYGEAYTAPNYRLYSCGLFPAMKESKSGYFVPGELYAIDEKTKLNLDAYEGADDGFYTLKAIKLQKISLVTFDKLPDSLIYSYIFNGDVSNFEKISFWA